MKERLTSKDIGYIIRKVRKELLLSQLSLSYLCNVQVTFIRDLENGKPSCQIDKALLVLSKLRIKIDLIPPEINLWL